MKTLANRALYLFLLFWLISLLSFAAVKAAPNTMLGGGELNPSMTPEAREHMARLYGLDKPLWEQYGAWVGGMAHLDFGVSYVSGRPVIEEIRERIGVTLTLNGVSMALIFALSLQLGIAAAFRPGGRFDAFVTKFSLVSYAMPGFYLSILLLMLFSLTLPLFPSGGIQSYDAPASGAGRWLDMAWHLVLPVTALTVTGFGSVVLYIRALAIEILKSDYILFAQARGFERRRLVRHYLLPNLMPSFITFLGLSLPGLFGGSVILEAIFSIEGMGQLFYQSALSRDYPVILGIVMIGAFLTLLGNILADIALLRLNPFTRSGFKE